jgi:hypothetical protein
MIFAKILFIHPHYQFSEAEPIRLFDSGQVRMKARQTEPFPKNKNPLRVLYKDALTEAVMKI